jgi:hypothetical protein
MSNWGWDAWVVGFFYFVILFIMFDMMRKSNDLKSLLTGKWDSHESDAVVGHHITNKEK